MGKPKGIGHYREARIRWSHNDELDRWVISLISGGSGQFAEMLNAARTRGAQQNQRFSTEFYKRHLRSSCQRLRRDGLVRYQANRWRIERTAAKKPLKMKPPIARVIGDLESALPILEVGEEHRKQMGLPPNPAFLAVRQALEFLV